MMNNYSIEHRDLPIGLVSEDPDQPRSDDNTNIDRDRLLISMKALGIQQPIAVMTLPSGKYKVIDGHRRYRCAEELGLKTIPCRIYPELEPGELERVRFELQNNRRPWKPLERATALARIKETTGAHTNKALAELLFISETLVSNSLNLGKQREDYKELMEECGVKGSYQTEFVKLRPKLRPIKEFDVDSIVHTIFDRVQNSVIRSAKDFRTLGRIFLRATANQNHIYEFLSDPDMTVRALELNTLQSGFSLWVEQVIKKIQTNEKGKIQFSSQEKALLGELQNLLQKNLS